MTVVQEPIQDRCGDHRIAQHVSPFSEALVGREDDAAALLAGRNQGKECGRRRSVIRPHPEFIDHQDLGREVDPHPPIQAVLDLSPVEIFEELIRAHEVDPWPASIALSASATLRCILPTPGGPSRTILAASPTNASVQSSLICRSSIDGWIGKIRGRIEGY